MTDERRRIPVRDKRSSATPSDHLPTDDLPSDVAPGRSPTVEATEQETVALRVEGEEAWKLAGERLDQLKRLKADYENLRTRTARERTEYMENAALGLVEPLLGVLDDLQRAIESATETESAMVNGMQLVLRRFQDVLAGAGLEAMDSAGAEFDPHQHEAVSSLPGDVESPTVTDVIRPGYRFKGRTLRPALVAVEVPRPSDEASPAQEPSEED